MRFDVDIPKTRIVDGHHTEYLLTIKCPEASWEISLWRRYSEFASLKRSLERAVGQPIPYIFPDATRTWWSQLSTDPEVVRTRKAKFTTFLNEMLNDAFDSRWRDSRLVHEFLKIPQVQKSPQKQPEVSVHDIQTALEECRKLPQDQRPKKLAKLRLQLANLERTIGPVDSPQIQALKDEINGFSNEINTNADIQITSSEFQLRPGRRRLGETAETKPLSDQQLVQVHSDRMQEQDSEIQKLHQIVQRQKEISLEINGELQQQNELLDDIHDEVDNVGRKLHRAGAIAERFNT